MKKDKIQDAQKTQAGRRHRKKSRSRRPHTAERIVRRDRLLDTLELVEEVSSVAALLCEYVNSQIEPDGAVIEGVARYFRRTSAETIDRLTESIEAESESQKMLVAVSRSG
jgi:hypothetical protein